jgi:hypothetical protein
VHQHHSFQDEAVAVTGGANASPQLAERACYRLLYEAIKR